MSTEAEIISRVRTILGDQSEPFRQTYRGTGVQDEFDLPVVRISVPSLRLFTLDPAAAIPSPVDLIHGTDFTVDTETGVLRLTTVLPRDVLLTAEGKAFGMFTDDELNVFIGDALLQHTQDRYETVRYRNEHGFIDYERTALQLQTLPEIEHLPVAVLASVEALWALSTDAATDIDVTTSEGTHVPRSQRFRQLQAQIEMLTSKYRELSSLLGIGLYRIEMSNLRRVSRTTNRLVPVYVAREFDQVGMPTRITTEIDAADADWDGPPSPGNRGLY